MRDLDVQTLTRIANELFSGLSATQAAPGSLEPPGVALTGLDAQGFDPQSFAPQGVAPQGFGPQALAPQGFNPQAVAPRGFDPNGVGAQGFDPRGLDPRAFDVSAPAAYSAAAREFPNATVPQATPAPQRAADVFALDPSPALAPSFYFLEHVREPVVPTHSLGVHEAAHRATAPFDVLRIKDDFPILSEHVKGRKLVWLDNAATTQKPSAVIERLKYFYEHENSNIHRAAHDLAARATDAYEDAREKVRVFLNASSTREIVFVRGATEAINLVAQTFGRAHVDKDDEIIVSHLEHHANIVPWQQLANSVGAKLHVIPVDDDGQLLLSEYESLLGPRTKLVAVTQVSNALGTVTDVKRIVQLAHAAGARVLIDGAQAVSHMPVDVRALDADFYVFSGHKVFAPTGIGVLFGKADLLDQLPPWQGGGNMIEDVTFERTVYQPSPARFEAGTGNIADAVGLGAAIDYVTRLGMPLIEAYEQQLLAYGTALLQNIPGLRIVGTAAHKAGVLSFVLEGFRTDEVSSALNEHGIAVRGGHHCAQPILRRFGLESTVRPSLAFYNECADLDALAQAILRIKSRRNVSVTVPLHHGF